MITLLDYGAGNVRSVINAIEKLGEKVKIVSNRDDILSAEKLVFPGVGSFGNMMRILNEKGLRDPLKDYLTSGRPFLGICLGLHALFEESEEAPGEKGLGILKGTVKRFDIELSVPHIGWNGIHIKKPTQTFNGLKGDEKLYFVHSYYVAPDDDSVVLTTTDYGVEFVSSIQTGHITATQFHPEKSGPTGLSILKNFLRERARENPPVPIQSETKLAKRIIACLDVRSNDQGELVVTKGDQYDVREKGDVRDLGNPVELARRYYEEGADEITFLNITGFRDFPLEDMPMIEVLKQTSRNVFVPLTIGGGIRDYTDKHGEKYTALEVAAEYFRSGADKISIGSDAVLIGEAYLETGQKTGESSIEQISEDHSFVQEQIHRGILTPEEASQSELKNIVTRALGANDSVEVSIDEFAVLENDSLLLCSDGLTDMLNDEDILKIYLQEEGDPKRTCSSLVDLANERGGRDNITVLIVNFKDVMKRRWPLRLFRCF